MDWCLLMAFRKNFQNILRVLLMYDVVCKYGINLLKRFDESPELRGKWPKFREFIKGVGVWHIYAHIRKCFPRFNPVFIFQIGLVDGEILETLWALLNLITACCRTMSVAAREETINAHMNDNNYKKMVDMSKSVSVAWCWRLTSRQSPRLCSNGAAPASNSASGRIPSTNSTTPPRPSKLLSG